MLDFLSRGCSLSEVEQFKATGYVQLFCRSIAPFYYVYSSIDEAIGRLKAMVSILLGVLYHLLL